MRIAAALLALALAAASVQAQVTINPKVGISFSDMNDATADVSTKGRMGYQAGVDLRLGGRLYLQPGLHWQQTGLEQSTLIGPFDLDVRGLHIPALVGVRVGSGLAGLRLVGGPTLTLIRSVNENNGGVSKDLIRERQLGAMAGVGLDLMGLSVDLTGELGLSSYFESGFDSKLRTIRLSGGIRF